MSAYTSLIRPLLFAFAPETAHHVAMRSLRLGMRLPHVQTFTRELLRLKHPMLRQRLFGLDFMNPVGLAAGFDKNAHAIKELAALGFSHIEAGTVTALGQLGNPQPRSFRLPADKSLINRMGFNNDGCAVVARRLAADYDMASGQRRPPCILGINIGKSKLAEPEQTVDDHLQSVEALSPYADYMVVNVSCPNVEGVTALQSSKNLEPLLAAVRKRLRELAPQCRMLVKVAPDLSAAHMADAVSIIIENGADGIIATNTSTKRDGLRTNQQRIDLIGKGGLSGQAIRAQSTAALANLARLVDQRLPIIGVGGIDSADAAWEKIVHGASLVQVYTGFIYQGPLLVRAINRGLVVRLKQAGLRHVREAVGRDL